MVMRIVARESLYTFPHSGGGHGFVMPATNEFHDCFLAERTRTCALAQAFLYSMESGWEWVDL